MRVNTINITDCDMDEERYRDCADLEAMIRGIGFDGIEFMHIEGGKEAFFDPSLVFGVHLRYFNEWVDLWRGDLNGLKKEYDSLETAKKIFGGLDPSGMMAMFREDLERAKRLDVRYVVFHVSNVKIPEYFSGRCAYRDEEVVDAAAELINELLDGHEYKFEFLLENLWWPGLTMTRPEITGRLLDQIHYPKTGIMLDTGHLLHTNLELQTQEEGIAYIKEMIRNHGDLAKRIRGIHLNQSLTGAYVKELYAKHLAMPKTYEERISLCYQHVFQIDRHEPFTTRAVRELLEVIDPAYVTFELISVSREAHERALKLQWEALYGEEA